MARQSIKLFDVWPETMEALSRTGLLLNSIGADGKANTMAIGWMTGGIIWGKPILIVYVRPSRFTYGRLEQVAEFTVNVLPPEFGEAIQLCGTVSGRDGDKLGRAHLTAVAGQKVRVPIIEQGLVHYECRTVHRNDVDPAAVAEEVVASSYAHGDFHRCYFGEVLAAYAAPDARQRLRSALL